MNDFLRCVYCCLKIVKFQLIHMKLVRRCHFHSSIRKISGFTLKKLWTEMSPKKSTMVRVMLFVIHMWKMISAEPENMIGMYKFVTDLLQNENPSLIDNAVSSIQLSSIPALVLAILIYSLLWLGIFFKWHIFVFFIGFDYLTLRVLVVRPSQT